jgi:hypothetical protein
MAKQAAQSITFTPEQLQAYVDAAITKVMEVKQAHEEHKRSDDMSSAVLKAFKKQGFKAETIVPHETVRTYNLWIEAGRKVRQGETSVKVRNLRLFHVTQTDALNPVEAKAALAALAEKRAAKTADKLPKPSPISAAPVAAKPKAKGRAQPAQPSA